MYYVYYFVNKNAFQLDSIEKLSEINGLPLLPVLFLWNFEQINQKIVSLY